MPGAVGSMNATWLANFPQRRLKCQLRSIRPRGVPLRTDTVAYNRPRLTITRREPVGAMRGRRNFSAMFFEKLLQRSAQS